MFRIRENFSSDALDYKEMITVVEEIEKAGYRPEYNVIDISTIEEAQNQKHAPNYKDLLHIATTIEGNVPLEEQLKKTQPSRTFEVQPVEKPYKEMKESAKTEIADFSKSLGTMDRIKPMKPFSIQLSNEEELILPKLSVPDQVDELQKLISGLNDNAFNETEKSIIKKELEGLYEEVEKGWERGTFDSGDIDKSLLLLRDQRLGEALKIIELKPRDKSHKDEPKKDDKQ